ncbi:MAG: L-seryl-tRNA selenium transferase [Candidatus Latescibacterota bacterium]|nr:L-seryl-tRNA selenium transferase [Candidatus Latescibacterota bacterium]
MSRDVYADLGVVPIINAAGSLTRMSGSVMHPEVAEAISAASREFVVMSELHESAGRRVAELVEIEAAHVCSCATAGIALMAAAVMAGTDGGKIRQLPNTGGMADRFVAFEAHRNAFDQALRLAGGTFVDVLANPRQMREALDRADVAAAFYTFSWFNTEDALSLPEVVKIAHGAGKPVLVDAAAEVPPVENLRRFVDEGADLVAYSGGKAMRGPQASGIVLGRTDLIAACAANDSPNMSVGRGMKAGKEEIVGAVKAVELYVQRDHDRDSALWEARVALMVERLSQISGVCSWRQLPFGLGQQIPHAAVSWDEEELCLSHEQAATQMLKRTPRIAIQLIHEPVYEFARKSGRELRLHPHTLREGEERVVAEALADLLTGPS